MIITVICYEPNKYGSATYHCKWQIDGLNYKINYTDDFRWHYFKDVMEKYENG